MLAKNLDKTFMYLQKIIEKHWYEKNNYLISIVLIPLSIMFFMVSKLHSLLYKLQLLKSYTLPVPVVVIGNINIGGVGKTPLTRYIAQTLIESGISVGVVLRGYKGKNRTPKIVKHDSSSLKVGDEAILYAENNIPVAIGKNKYLAGMQLLQEYPNIKMILTDDGLQHYKLRRNYEVVVVDANRMFGNGWMLPNGPLRETTAKLRHVNAIIINGSSSSGSYFRNKFNIPNNVLIDSQMVFLLDIYNPVTKISKSKEYFNNKKICVIAAIGNPNKFFKFIKSLGIVIEKSIAFSDHYYYKDSDIPNNYDIILVTEKDYTKMKLLNNDKIWVVKIAVKLTSNKLINKISCLI